MLTISISIMGLPFALDRQYKRPTLSQLQTQATEIMESLYVFQGEDEVIWFLKALIERESARQLCQLLSDFYKHPKLKAWTHLENLWIICNDVAVHELRRKPRKRYERQAWFSS